MADAEGSELWSLYVEGDCSQAQKEALDAIIMKMDKLRGTMATGGTRGIVTKLDIKAALAALNE